MLWLGHYPLSMKPITSSLLISLIHSLSWAMPMQMTQTQSRRSSVRRDNEEGKLVRLERLMMNNNSHLEKIFRDMEENSTHSERHERESSLGSPVKQKNGGSLQNLDHFIQKTYQSMRQGEDSPLKLPSIGKKDSSMRNPLGKIHDDSDEDDNSPSNFRKKKSSGALEEIVKFSKSKSTRSSLLKNSNTLQLQHVKSSPGAGGLRGFDVLGEEEEELSSHSIPLEESPKKKKKKSKNKKNKHNKTLDTKTSIEREDDVKDNKVQLKQVLWAMVYPALLSRIVEKKINQRKDKYEHNSMKMLQDRRTDALDFLNKHCMTALKSLYNEGKTMTLVNENLEAGTLIPDKELKKRFGLILSKLTAIMESLNTAITSTNLPQTLVDFLADITDKSSAIPPKFLTEFEISCLDVSYYGTLRNMSPIRIKMIVGMFLLVKGLIYVFLSQPWTYVPKMKESASLNNALSDCYGLFQGKYPEHKDNQAVIAPEKRIKPLKNPLAAFPDAENFKKPDRDAVVNEVIVGLYSKYDLKKCFDSDKASVEKLKTLVSDCLEKLFVIVEDAQKEKRSADKEAESI